jgi:hypothetical protein
MAKLLFKLNSVPDDEAEEIRALLAEAEINFYETTSGNWGLSFAAIWLKDELEYEQANELIENYQAERYTRVREHHQSLKESGENLTRWQAFKQSPIKIPLVIIFVITLLYFSTAPFFLS